MGQVFKMVVPWTVTKPIKMKFEKKTIHLTDILYIALYYTDENMLVRDTVYSFEFAQSYFRPREI